MTLLIVGAPRTGSSFMVRALMNAAGFAGMAEGHVTPLIAAIDNIIVDYYANLRSRGLLDIPENTIANIPENRLRREIFAVFERFDRDLFPFANRLLDKTVNMQGIAALPLLVGMWPNTKILYLKRDGVENVLSAEKYFNLPMHVACGNWAACGDEWDRVKPLLPEGSYLEVDHWAMTDEPRRIADELAEHLELASGAKERFRNYVAEHTREWVATRVRRPTLSKLAWSTERLNTFVSICGNQMIRQGYATEEEVATLRHAQENDSASLPESGTSPRSEQG